MPHCATQIRQNDRCVVGATTLQAQDAQADAKAKPNFAGKWTLADAGAATGSMMAGMGMEGTIVGISDCLGDWREELIVSVPGELRIYSTTVPATTRRVCLMQDRQYRTSVARQTMGYFYPPLLGTEGPRDRGRPSR